MILGTEFQFVLIWGIVTITVSNKRPNGAKIDVSVIFTRRVYFSSDLFNEFLRIMPFRIENDSVIIKLLPFLIKIDQKRGILILLIFLSNFKI